MKRTVFYSVISVLLCLLFNACADTTSRVTPRSDVGLALSGGGAKAAAHIGVLKYLEKEGVEVGYIAGTSMGAFVGGLYAAGYTADEIDSLWCNEDWISLFDESAVLIGGDRSFLGLVKGDDLEDNLRRVLAKKGCTRIEDTRIKFCCTASVIKDYETLEEVVFDSGDMAKAIRASMAHPIGYMPLEYNGMLLVDGGMLNNLPVDVVKRMGASKVIAVDLQSGAPKDREDADINLCKKMLIKWLKSKPYINIGLYLSHSNWIVNWFEERPDIGKRKANSEIADIYIHPDLTDYNIVSFSELDAYYMKLYGEDEAQKYENEIRALRR